MKIITTAIAAFVMLCFACKSSKVATQPAPAPLVCDTLVLRQICDYCEGENSVYYPRKIHENTRCLCYSDYDEGNALKQISDTIARYKNTIRHITIENPSGVISDLDFKSFTRLESLLIFGNDYNTDRLQTFPADLLELKSLKRIIFDGVRFDLKELARIKKQYPSIQVIGIVDGL